MFRKSTVLLGLVWLGLLMQTAMADEALPPAGQLIPQDAIVALEVSQPKTVLDAVLDPKLTSVVTSSPVYQKQVDNPGFQQFRAVIAYLEARLGTDWKTGLRKLVGGGVTFAATADGAVLLIVDAEDGKMLGQLHEIILEFARGEAQKQGQPDRVASREYGGVTGWTLGKEEVHAIVGNRLVLSNRSEALKAALDRHAEGNGKSLASSPAYQAARKAAGPDAVARAFVNLKVIKQHPPVQKALTENENPLAALLFAGVTEALRGSSWLSAGLHVEGDTLALQATVDGKAVDAEGPAAFVLSGQPDDGALPNLNIPRRIAALSLYRDLHAFYAAKDDLFPERTSGLIFFENMMGIFFSGLDLTEEVLGETRPEVRLVVAQQEYDPAAGMPQLQIPAFAAVFRLHNPEQFGEVVEEAWQKAVGLINFTRGQQAQPGLIIDRPTHGDTRFTMAYFRAPDEGERENVDSRFNFRPAVARLGEYLILSSTDGLAADLIDALKQEASQKVESLAEAHSLLEINAVQLASILGANRENLVRKNMLDEGNTQQQAETETDLLLTVMKYFGRATLELGSHEGQPQAKLAVKLNLP